MDFTRLKYIKNVNNDNGWAYENRQVEGSFKDSLAGAYFRLNFKKGEKGERVDNHTRNLHKGALIILSQKPPKQERYLTHVVELVNDGSEDKPQWELETWGIFRWVKVHWVIDFDEPNKKFLDQEVMGGVDWGWENTLAKSLDADGLMKRWKSIEALKTHLHEVFN